MHLSLRSEMRPAKRAEPPNGGRRQCGEPSPRSGRRRLRHEVREHFMNQT
jgi:hypothetical protein